LDLDAAKTKLRRVKTQPGKEAVSRSLCQSSVADVVVDISVVNVNDNSGALLLWCELEPNCLLSLESLEIRDAPIRHWPIIEFF